MRGGSWEAVSRQNQVGAASPSQRQLERAEDETLFVVGLSSHPPSRGMSALPFPFASTVVGKMSQVRTSHLDFCEVTEPELAPAHSRAALTPPAAITVMLLP